MRKKKTMKPTGVKIGQIQWLLFWLALFATPHFGEGVWIVWIISMFFDDKDL
jgi:hypothetical protein